MLPEAVIYLTAAGTVKMTQAGVCAFCFTAQRGGKYKGLEQVIVSICIFQESLFVILRSDFTFSVKIFFFFSSYELVRGNSII